MKIVAEVFKVTIVPDKDIQGTVTRYFRNTTLQETLTLLLEPLGYSFRVNGTIYFINKKKNFKVSYEEITNTYVLEADNSLISEIVDELSAVSKQTFIHKGNSNDRVTIRIYNKKLQELVALLAKSIDYDLVKVDNGTILSKKEEPLQITGLDGKNVKALMEGTEDNITVKVVNQSTKDLMLLLFNKFNKEFMLLSNSSSTIPYLDIKSISLQDLLLTLCEYSGQSYTYSDSKYYIYDSISPKMINRLRESSSFKLRNLNSRSFPTLIPSNIIPPSSYKIEEQLNSVTVYGSAREIEYFIDIIKKVEERMDSYTYIFFQLKYKSVKEIKNLLPEQYKSLQIQILEENNAFYMYLNTDDEKKIRDLIQAIDVIPVEYVYKLKYLKPDDVVKGMLPDYIDKKNIYLNTNDASLVFRGNEDMKMRLFKYLDILDVAPPVIRYQLLIVEYIKSNVFKLNWGIGMQPITNGIGDIFKLNKAGLFDKGDLISVNFDIPTVFGTYFSVMLEEQLNESKAKIQMSTEVYGLSGESVTLANTKTLQFADTKKDENGNEVPFYNATTFGLNLEIKGRATSSNEIFLEVSTKISDEIEGRGVGQPPNTSEKSVKNSIRSQSGKPIILGGLTS